MTTFICVCLLVMPWIYIPLAIVREQFRIPQMAFMDLMFFGIITYSFLNGLRFAYRNKYFAWLVAWVSFNFWWGFVMPFNLVIQNKGRSVNIWMLEPMIHVLLGLWAAYIILSSLDRDDFARIAKTLCFSSCFISIWAILQYVGFDPFGKIAAYNCANKVSACLDNPNLVGNYIALTFPLLFIFLRKRPNIYWIITPILLGGVYVTKSHLSQALIGTGLWIYLFLTFRRNKRILLVLLLSLIPILLYVSHTDFAKMSNFMSDRIPCWKAAWQKLKINPLFGQGIGVWKTYCTYINTTYWYYVHNDFLERAVEIGGVGIFFMVLLVINSVKNFKLLEKLHISYITSFIVFLLLMFFSFPFESPTVGIVGVFSFLAVEKL